MAHSVLAYQSDDETLHLKESDAIKADAAYWKKVAQSRPEPSREVDHSLPESGYGSSGGGGHD